MVSIFMLIKRVTLKSFDFIRFKCQLRLFMISIFTILDDDQEDEEICDYPSDYLILDDYDFALIGCKRARKRLRVDSDSSEEIQYVPEVLSNLKTVMLRTD